MYNSCTIKKELYIYIIETKKIWKQSAVQGVMMKKK